MQSHTKNLIRYVIPSAGGLFVTYLYNVVDGIFVGQGVGTQALGAVNIGVPFLTFAVAIAAMFPMGGASMVAIHFGKRNEKEANEAFMTAFACTGLLALVLMIVGMMCAPWIIDLSGGAKLSLEMREMAIAYLFVYSLFSVPMLLGNGLAVFVRNDGNPNLSLIGMGTGAVANIVLDWLFIFPFRWGVIGAAAASGIGQILTVLVLLSHFLGKKGKLRIRLRDIRFGEIKEIAMQGIPESVTQFTTPVTALAYNIQLASLIGDIGVSVFSVLSFIYSLVNAILTGVAQGVQPLWGISYGKNDQKMLNVYLKAGFWINGILALIMIGLLWAFPGQAISIFNSQTSLVENGVPALRPFALSFLPMAFNLIATYYLFSIKQTLQADSVALCRGVVLKAAAILLMPAFFGTFSIWYAPLVAEILTLLLVVILMKKRETI